MKGRGWRRGYVQEETKIRTVSVSIQQQDDEFQPKKKKNRSFITTNQLKTGEKRRVVGVYVFFYEYLSFPQFDVVY